MILDDDDFESGSLRQTSNVRPNRLFTADERIKLYRLGHLRPDKLRAIVSKVVEVLRQ